jgi:hypothetical protein
MEVLLARTIRLCWMSSSLVVFKFAKWILFRVLFESGSRSCATMSRKVPTTPARTPSPERRSADALMVLSPPSGTIARGRGVDLLLALELIFFMRSSPWKDFRLGKIGPAVSGAFFCGRCSIGLASGAGVHVVQRIPFYAGVAQRRDGVRAGFCSFPPHFLRKAYGKGGCFDELGDLLDEVTVMVLKLLLE